MDLKKAAINIFMKAVHAADPYQCLKKEVTDHGDFLQIANKKYPYNIYKKILVVGGGKASPRMGQALEEILGGRITSGWINTKDDHTLPLKHCTVHECSHPIPDKRGIDGTLRIMEMLSTADENTLVICLLSGGGSALLPAPAEGIGLRDIQTTTKLLLEAGADIEELNAVRKHLSILKGGGMSRLVFPARLHVLIVSDVIGDRLDSIASGPAVADPGTFSDCIEICRRYGIYKELPRGIRDRFIQGRKGSLPETAKSGDAFLLTTENTLIGSNRLSIEAARVSAAGMGFHTLVVSTMLKGEASELGTFFASIASEIQASGNPVAQPACVIGGGETTVTVRGSGKGGRNQEIALSAAQHLAGMEHVVFLSGGTDGTDGPTDAAGGIVDGFTAGIGKNMGLSIHDSLCRNDSYNYLKETDSLLKTGPTGTNVMDIQLLLMRTPE